MTPREPLPETAAVAVTTADGVRTWGLEGRYLVYSVTKTFIGVLLLRLAAEGRLRLDDPVRRWVSSAQLPETSLRQLLNHTSGIADYARLPAYVAAVGARPAEAWTDEELLARALEEGPDFAPGAGWTYSNTGYLLLRLVLERAAPAGFADALREHVLAPLELRETTLVATREELTGLVPGRSTQLATPDVRTLYDPRWVGHRSLASTSADLCRFFAALTGGELLAPAEYAALTTFADVGPVVTWFVRPSYGLGVMGDPEHPLGVVVGHGGGGPGYTAAAFATGGSAAVVLAAEEVPGGLEEATLRLLESR